MIASVLEIGLFFVQGKTTYLHAHVTKALYYRNFYLKVLEQTKGNDKRSYILPPGLDFYLQTKITPKDTYIIYKRYLYTIRKQSYKLVQCT